MNNEEEEEEYHKLEDPIEKILHNTPEKDIPVLTAKQEELWDHELFKTKDGTKVIVLDVHGGGAISEKEKKLMMIPVVGNSSRKVQSAFLRRVLFYLDIKMGIMFV